MTPKFSVGMRVAVYDVAGRKVGKVTLVNPDSVLVVMPHDAGTMQAFYHPKQLRKLKPKRKAREWEGEWMTVNDARAKDFHMCFVPATIPMVEYSVMRVREVPKRGAR